MSNICNKITERHSFHINGLYFTFIYVCIFIFFSVLSYSRTCILTIFNENTTRQCSLGITLNNISAYYTLLLYIFHFFFFCYFLLEKPLKLVFVMFIVIIIIFFFNVGTYYYAKRSFR